MIIFLAGGVYGRINEFYEKVADVENRFGVKAEYILQTGNFGCYPDPDNVDRGMRLHDGAGDFADLYLKQAPMPRPTIFTAGKHEDHRWLEDRLSRSRMELIPNLVWLVNGYSTTLGFDDNRCRVLSLGKVYSPNTWKEGRKPKKKKTLAHYTRSEVEKACSGGLVDILLLHEHPQMEGIPNVISATRPKLIIYGNTQLLKTSKETTNSLHLKEMQIVPFLWDKDEFGFLPPS